MNRNIWLAVFSFFIVIAVFSSAVQADDKEYENNQKRSEAEKAIPNPFVSSEKMSKEMHDAKEVNPAKDSSSPSGIPSDEGSFSRTSTRNKIYPTNYDKGAKCEKCGRYFPSDYPNCPYDCTKLVPVGPNPTEKGQLVTDLDIEMVLVEGGCFWMGSKVGSDDEKPVHKVCLESFSVGKYEVTQSQWEAIMGENPAGFKGPRHPVENVSWRDSQEFIYRLNKKTGKQYRLPTEAEWEYAARGGPKSKAYKYSGSDIVNHVAWFSENSGGETKSVGQKDPNELGIYDMSGNVKEWCADWYGQNYYRWGPTNNPQGPSEGTFRVVRGGSWFNDPGSVRAADRGWYSRGARVANIGFRLVLQGQ